MTKVIKGEFEKIMNVKVEDVSLTCDTPHEVFNNEVSRLSGMDDDLFTYEVEVANIPCNSNMDGDSEHEADDDMGYDPSDIRGDDDVELTDEESSDDMDELTEVFRIDTNLFNFETPMCKAFKEFNYLFWKNDGYYSEGNLPGTYIIGNQLHYQGLEWYEALEDYTDQKRRWNIYTNYDDAYEIDHEDNKREELCEFHELPVCNISKYMMIKYSFNNDEDRVPVKEDELRRSILLQEKRLLRLTQEIFNNRTRMEVTELSKEKLKTSLT
ncbi:hypothetical protein Tco_0088284 [Tanacetum coccineum]